MEADNRNMTSRSAEAGQHKPGPVRRAWLAPAAVFAAALAIQAAGILFAMRSSYHEQTSCLDGFHYYFPLAKSLWSSGRYLQRDGEFCTRVPPAYPLVLCPAVGLGSAIGLPPIRSAQAVNVLCAALAAAGVYLVARRRLTPALAGLVAVAFAAYPPFVWLSRDAYSEQLFTLLLVFGLYGLGRSCDRPGVVPLGLGMLLLGLATLTRPIGLLVPAAYLFGLLARGRLRAVRWRAWALGLAVYALTLAPWCFIVSRHLGRTVLVASSFSSSHLDGIVRLPGDPIAEAASRSFTTREPSLGALAAFHVRMLRHDPGAYVAFWLRKIACSWYATESGVGHAALAALNAPLLLASAVGIGLAVRRSAFGPEQAALLCVLLYFWGMSTMVWSTARYMVPAVWVLLLFAAEIPVVLGWGRGSAAAAAEPETSEQAQRSAP